jgi:hypothetical protein
VRPVSGLMMGFIEASDSIRMNFGELGSESSKLRLMPAKTTSGIRPGQVFTAEGVTPLASS